MVIGLGEKIQISAHYYPKSFIYETNSSGTTTIESNYRNSVKINYIMKDDQKIYLSPHNNSSNNLWSYDSYLFVANGDNDFTKFTISYQTVFMYHLMLTIKPLT